MKKIFLSGGVAVFLLVLFSGCKKQIEAVSYATVEDYYPLHVGKSYLYKLDSTVLFNFGSLITRSYQALDSVESSFTDNSGRLSYRIFRYLRDTAGKQPWTFNNTFFATFDNNQVEYVEDNLRFIKLHNPIKNDYSWPGNSYIETNTTYSFLQGWAYTYQDADQQFTASGVSYDSTVTVLQKDEYSPDGPEDLTLPFLQRDYSKEVYSKGVGLVYKDFLHWIWQRPVIDDHGTLGTGSYNDGAYGIRLTLISHN